MSILVFTNGCFDLLHPGHINLLEGARALGDRLVVGINSDKSVRAIKGAGRPLMSQDDRAEVLRGLRSVDDVIIFDEPTPARLIEELRPDVLVKGGDWPVDQIIGSDVVLAGGGRVLSIPFKAPHSTSGIIERLKGSNNNENAMTAQGLNDGQTKDCVAISLREHQDVIDGLSTTCTEAIQLCAGEIFQALIKGRKILLCGNGGSAADAQHIAAEFVGRFEAERKGLPALSLTTDTSALTSIANDYGFVEVFSRQVAALAVADDVLVGISTSGNSPNILEAIMTARRIGCRTIGLTGAEGKRLASLCDAAVIVPSTRTARVQEAHGIIGHLWCEIVDQLLVEHDTRN
jgi:D-sedoheptulose 7-phosphate isomerase